MLLLDPENTTVPLNVLPPSRGMTFRTTPAVSASPRPPEVLSTTSCAPATFMTAAFEFAPAHPMLRPSDRVRESDGRPPCMVEALPPVPPVMPPESPKVLIPGITAWMPVAFLEVGMAARMSLLIVVYAFAFHRTETGQRERHRIGARPKIDDSVLAGDVAGDRADFFDEDGAGGFHGYAGQHGARRVLDDAGDGRLSPRGRGATCACGLLTLMRDPRIVCAFYSRPGWKSTGNKGEGFLGIF